MKKRLIPGIKKYILNGSEKNESAPQIFLILCIYAIIVSLYTGVFFSVRSMIIRFALSLIIIIAYVLIERSSLSSLATAFLTPSIIISVLIFGSIYFGGDFLIFTYNTAIAMISLTYLRPKGLLGYIALSSLAIVVILFVFGINLLGPVFSAVYNVLYFMVSAALNILTYIFCKSYVQALDEMTNAKNEASLAAQAKGTFLANMSHEIRTPLNAIIGLTEAELRRDLPPASLENLRKVHTSGNLLMVIINDVLDMSKIESGKFDLVSADYDLANMIYDTAILNMVHKKSKPINFILTIDETIPRKLTGDDIRIKQILGNLLSNAFKYTQEGSVELRAAWQPVEKSIFNENPSASDLIKLTFEVQDTGMGINDEDLKKLFSEYAQVNQQSTRGIEGTGLGLAICTALVKLMGGELTAKSEYGKGSTFTVSVIQEASDRSPIGKKAADEIKNFTFTPEDFEAAIDYISFNNRRVLVVDDVEINLDVAAASLEPYELNIDCITNGREAIRRIKDGEPRYDLIFMDHMMPEMDGVETTRAIRALETEYAARVPIIALTANVFAEKDNIFMQNGFQGFLSKPIDLHKLDIVLKKWFT